MQYTPVIIIGAPRSGTNMLRDVLASLPGVATWPCDEINSIWRHGNVRYPSDEFIPDMARPEVCNYIRKQFDWVSRKYKAQTVVEKTCANSLRMGFVDQVVPEAKFIFIRRDGLDAVGSAIKRWKAELDIPYLARKARFVPASDLPYYASRFLWNRIYRIFSRDERLAFWGPKLDNMAELLHKYPLGEVCALQWKQCVDKAALAFDKMEPERWIELAYEDFVTKPETRLKEILKFLNINAREDLITKAVGRVSPRSIGKGREQFGKEDSDRLGQLMEKTLGRCGYV